MRRRSVWKPQSVFYAGKTIYWEPFYPNIITNYLKALPRDMTFKEALDNVDTILNTPYEEADEHLKKVLMTVSPKDYVETALPISHFMMRIDGRKVGTDLTVGDVLEYIDSQIFEGDINGSESNFSEKIVKTRKFHQCCVCEKEIPKRRRKTYERKSSSRGH